MPLFFSTTTPPTSSELLNAQIVRIRNNAKASFNQMLEHSNQMVVDVWRNFQFTPQQIITSLSADAVNQLNYSLSLRTHLVSVIAAEGIPLSSIEFFKPLSAYAINGSTVTLIPSAYSGP